MVNNMTSQNYLIIENNVVTNVCLWDGDVNTWQPPADATMLVQSIIPAMVWETVMTDKKVTDWVLVEQMGAGSIGFTWDGTVLTTNEPQPAIPTT
jgi:hypothetical protein